MLIKQFSQTSKWSSFFFALKQVMNKSKKIEARNESWNDRHLRDSGKIWMKSQTGKEKKRNMC